MGHVIGEVYDKLLTRMEAGRITEKEWKKGIAAEDGITIQFDPDRVRKGILRITLSPYRSPFEVTRSSHCCFVIRIRRGLLPS